MVRLWLLTLWSFGLALPAMAGTLYRCVGADGVPNYSNKRVPDAVCKAIADTSETPQVASAPRSEKSSSAVVVSASEPAAADASVATGQAKNPSAASMQRVVFRSAPAGGTLLPVSSGAGARVTRGAVYKYEADGVTHYTNLRPKSSAQAQLLFSYIETCYACGALPGVNFGTVALNTSAYREEIRAAAQQFGVEEAVVRAVIHAESAFRPNARSHKGAQGLMQLIPATAARFGVVNVYDPTQNIRGGVQYLAWLMQRYSSNLTLVAAAYNAGEGAVDRNGGVPPYAETQRYVQRVGQLAERYRTALAGR